MRQLFIEALYKRPEQTLPAAVEKGEEKDVGHSSVGRAPGCDPVGRRFEPDCSTKFFLTNSGKTMEDAKELYEYHRDMNTASGGDPMPYWEELSDEEKEDWKRRANL